MDKIIEALSKLIPYEKLGIKKEIGEPLSVITLLIVVYVLGFFLKRFIKRYRAYKAAIKDLNPQFDYLSIRKARQYYIPTQYQNASPSRQEEPGFTHKYIARNKLIPFFIKVAFNEKAEPDRFYLILADSGMGKTTFMVNLFFAYCSSPGKYRKHSMKLLRFSNPDTISMIRSISSSDAKNTILLLDALDEDLGIISKDPGISDTQAFKNRLDEIIDATKNFAEVVITCRTQYFPGQEDDPYELKVKRPDEKGYYILNKIYISPFNDKEVKLYIKKRYGAISFINRKKKKRAAGVISKSKNLIMRPMLLSYIDYLIEGDSPLDRAFDIYETLVSKWLLREAEKRKRIIERDEFIQSLRRLSQNMAKAIYLNWKNEGRMHLTKEEAINIAKEYHLPLNPAEVTGQSLLTCDGLNNWKFSHKSIMEFFLAKEVFENPSFLKYLSFTGMDMAKKFYYEIPDHMILIENILKDNSVGGLEQSTQIPAKPFYTYPFPIFYDDYRINVGNAQDVFHYGGLGEYEATIQEAMAYCNRMNILYGYQPVYDDLGRLIDESGRVTDTVSVICGYRLPFLNEISELVVGRMGWFNQHKPGMNATIETEAGTEYHYFSFPANGELCIDATKICIAKIIKKYDLEPVIRKVNDRFHFSGNQTNFSIEEIPVPADSKDRYAFRLIFTP